MWYTSMGSCRTYPRTVYTVIAQLVAREEVGATVDVLKGEVDRGRGVPAKVGDEGEVERMFAKRVARVHRHKSGEQQNVQPHASSR